MVLFNIVSPTTTRFVAQSTTPFKTISLNQKMKILYYNYGVRQALGGTDSGGMASNKRGDTSPRKESISRREANGVGSYILILRDSELDGQEIWGIWPALGDLILNKYPLYFQSTSETYLLNFLEF